MAFDPLAPFADKAVLHEVLGELDRFDLKLDGPIPVRTSPIRPPPVTAAMWTS